MTLPDQPDFCWPLDPGCLGSTWEDLTPEVQERATALATGTLYRLTAGRVGGCPITVRPCAPGPSQSDLGPLLAWQMGQRGVYGGSTFGPVLWDGTWVNCGCGGSCGCNTGCEVVLGGYVGRVDEIRVDGTAVDLSDIKIVNNEKIVWQGSGTCPFPKDQNMALAAGEAGTFDITYLPAHPVDGAAAWAAGLLAVEFAKACAGDTKCRLPKGVTQVTRQGVSMTINSGAFPDGLTGIREVDAWIAMWNPRGMVRQPQVWSPDMPDAWVES